MSITNDLKYWSPSCTGDEHKEFTLTTWRNEVEVGNTQSGYIIWVNAKLAYEHADKYTHTYALMVTVSGSICQFAEDVTAKQMNEAVRATMRGLNGGPYREEKLSTLLKVIGTPIKSELEVDPDADSKT